MLIDREDLLKDIAENVTFPVSMDIESKLHGASKVIERIKLAPTIEGHKGQCVGDLVDRETVLRVLCKGCNVEFSEEPCEPNDCAIKTMLECLPTLTLEDLRPKGRWIPQDDTLTKFMCSACKARNYGGHEKYCPNCGAKMK